MTRRRPRPGASYLNSVWFRLAAGAGVLIALTSIVYSVGRQIYLDYSLNQEVSSARETNARLSAENEAYQRELAAATQPGGAEEEARRLGYVRPGEQVFIVSQPSPSPTPTAHPATAGVPAPAGKDISLWDQFWRWMTNHWR